MNFGIYCTLVCFLIFGNFVTVIGNDKIDETIELAMGNINELSTRIDLLEGRGSPSSNLMLYNERGVRYFFLGQFDLALDDFNHILTTLYTNKNMQSALFGAALWGRLLCHSYGNYEKEALEDLDFIRFHFLFSKSNCLCFNSMGYANNYGYSFFSAAQFENPNEKITSEECKDRVRGTANIMRLIVLKIPNNAIAQAVNFTITELEYAAYRCCERAHWTECLGPIIDGWHYLKNCMDKGVAIAPYLVGPSR